MLLSEDMPRFIPDECHNEICDGTNEKHEINQRNDWDCNRGAFVDNPVDERSYATDLIT